MCGKDIYPRVIYYGQSICCIENLIETCNFFLFRGFVFARDPDINSQRRAVVVVVVGKVRIFYTFISPVLALTKCKTDDLNKSLFTMQLILKSKEL